MKIHEYQAKEILRRFGVPLPIGKAAFSVDEAKHVAEEIGGKVVVKAQIHAGGRGKGGGVKLADNAQDAAELARDILGMNLVTHQTGPQGRIVKRLLIEEAMDIEKELYLGVVIDRAVQRIVIMASEAGGMEIEEVAATNPEKIIKEWIDPCWGLQPFQALRLAFRLSLRGAQARKAAQFILNMYRAFVEMDCSLAEINPLIVTKSGDILALDAKMNFDDNAVCRHKELQSYRDLDEEESLEIEASKYDLNYIKLDGTIGCMVNGAGLAMATMDNIKLAGGEPANFLDVGGGANVERVEHAFRILMSDEKVKAVLINIFGGIVRCDMVAQGILEAVKKINVAVPIVVRLKGTNYEEARQILQGSSLPFVVAENMKEAAEKVVAAISGQH
ncbi:ADP-forming succinate--CoA ligase subunit beta [bacterium]|nr:ADP-forming succinate--CoA ligase subunit beta [bacterium]